MRDPWSGVAPIASATRPGCGSGSLGTNDVTDCCDVGMQTKMADVGEQCGAEIHWNTVI